MPQLPRHCVDITAWCLNNHLAKPMAVSLFFELDGMISFPTLNALDHASPIFGIASIARQFLLAFARDHAGLSPVVTRFAQTRAKTTRM
jgi:hypothetical protein